MQERLSIADYRAELAKPKRNKFGARADMVDGYRFASGKEARRYKALKLAKAAGAIRDLRLQTRWPITVNGHLIGHYVSDFDYMEDGELVVEDTKGMKTALYRWKKKLMLAANGVEIRET